MSEGRYNALVAEHAAKKLAEAAKSNPYQKEKVEERVNKIKKKYKEKKEEKMTEKERAYQSYGARHRLALKDGDPGAPLRYGLESRSPQDLYRTPYEAEEPLDDEHISVDLKLKDVMIDFETADNIVVATMIDSYYSLKEEATNYLYKEKRKVEWQKEDSEYNMNLLDAVVTIIKHYAAYSKWPKELKEENDGI